MDLFSQQRPDEGTVEKQTLGLAEQPRGPVPAWSFSMLKKFEECPYRVYLSKVEKHPEPSSEAADRGTMLHDLAEDYIRGLSGEEVPHELRKLEMQYRALHDAYAEAPEEFELEENWGFTATWQPTGFFDDDVWGRMKLDVFRKQDTSAHIVDHKGLALDTPIPTPSGWTTMGELQVDDTVFSSSGKPCRVTAKSDIHHRVCYKLVFDDTSEVICDDEHLWPTEDGELLTTADIATHREAGQQIRIPVAKALETDDAFLGADPYVLGVWLADGKHTSGEITNPDPEVWDEIERRGYTLGKTSPDPAKCRVQTVKSLRAQLTYLGVLGNKHIPQQYLRASIRQRTDLLRGLMDGDGSSNKTRKSAVFSTTDEPLARQVFELVASLGQRPLFNKFKARGFGKVVDYYQITFRPLFDFAPFLLPRKMAPLLGNGNGKSAVRRVVSAEVIETVPTQCIMVDSPDHTYLCTHHMMVTHNSGKKFGNELKHSDQGLQYAVGAFKRYPDLEFVKVEFYYFDKGEILPKTFTRDRAMVFLPRIEQRAFALTNASKEQLARPKPSKNNCRFCPHAETGVCPWRVTS